MKHHLKQLYDTFLEKNLLKVLEPYSRVEIAHVAELMELGAESTLQRLSQMILDGKLSGTLDQGNGILLVLLILCVFGLFFHITSRRRVGAVLNR